jgi:CarD family transcriptional regulator
MQARPEKQFKVGDKAIYPTKGVAEVVSIKELDIAGTRQAFYELRLLDAASKFMVPVANAKKVGLRPPVSESEIKEVFEILREKTVVFDNQTWNRRYRAFKDKIRTGSVFDVAEVMRDLYLLKAEKLLSYGEKQMLEEARQLIVKEIAVARRRTEDKVRAEIEKIFAAN